MESNISQLTVIHFPYGNQEERRIPKMKEYTKPEMDIIELEKEDVLLTSGCCDGFTDYP